MSRVLWRFRLRTLLILLPLVAALLTGFRTLERAGRANRNRTQARVWAGERNKRQELAGIARSNGDIAGAAKWERLAAYADGWRRVFEHRASGGDPGHEPPIPKGPD